MIGPLWFFFFGVPRPAVVPAPKSVPQAPSGSGVGHPARFIFPDIDLIAPAAGRGAVALSPIETAGRGVIEAGISGMPRAFGVPPFAVAPWRGTVSGRTDGRAAAPLPSLAAIGRGVAVAVVTADGADVALAECAVLGRGIVDLRQRNLRAILAAIDDAA